MSTKIGLVCAAVLASSATAASAQITFQPSTASFGAVMGGQQAAIQQDLHKNDWGRRGAYGTGRAPMLGAVGGGPARPASTAYRADPSVTERVKRQFIDYVSQRSAGDGAKVRADLAHIDPVAAWSRIVAGDGLRPGDVADAYAAYWILNWAVATGGDNQRTQSLAVRDQVRATMSRNPAFQRLNVAQRQEMAEALMLNFLYQHDVFLQAQKRGDRDLVGQLQQASLARFQNEMRLDLRSLALTDQGFVKRG